MRYLFLTFAVLFGGLYLEVKWNLHVLAIPSLLFSVGTPFFLLFDYHKRKNVHNALIGIGGVYLLGQAVQVIVVTGLGLLLAGLVPFILFGVLFLKNKT